VVGLPFARWDTWYGVVLGVVCVLALAAVVVLLVRARRRWYEHDHAAWWAALIFTVLLNGVPVFGVPLPIGLFVAAWLWREEQLWDDQLTRWAEQGV
jgi:CDP-diglyceride synthetase